MMVNHMADNDDYGVITLDNTEPYAKKILENFTQKETLKILELTQKPCIQKLPYTEEYLICLMSVYCLQ
ncbi:MAG: hypothetical protein ACR2LL_13660 [Nitrosopumilus sp.]